MVDPYKLLLKIFRPEIIFYIKLKEGPVVKCGLGEKESYRSQNHWRETFSLVFDHSNS